MKNLQHGLASPPNCHRNMNMTEKSLRSGSAMCVSTAIHGKNTVVRIAAAMLAAGASRYTRMKWKITFICLWYPSHPSLRILANTGNVQPATPTIQWRSRLARPAAAHRPRCRRLRSCVPSNKQNRKQTKHGVVATSVPSPSVRPSTSTSHLWTVPQRNNFGEQLPTICYCKLDLLYSFSDVGGMPWPLYWL
jgi:hypothetical protein